MNIVVQGLRWLFGALALYAAVFVREDEEGAIQNLLETYWIRLMYTRDSALSRTARFMRGIAQVANRAFDTVLGIKLWSLQSVGVSLCFSWASFFACMLAVPHITPTPNQPTATYSISFVILVILGLLPSIIGRFAILIWAVCICWLLPSLVIFGYLTYRLWGYASLFRYIATIALLLSSSFGFDVLYIALTRWMLRRVSDVKRVYDMVGIIALDCLLGLVLVYVPMKTGTALMKHVGLSYIGLAVASVAMLNVGDIVACSVFLVIMVFMLAHRLLWPVLERPIYACQRYGLIRRKGLLWSIGTGLWFGPKGFEIVKHILRIV